MYKRQPLAGDPHRQRPLDGEVREDALDRPEHLLGVLLDLPGRGVAEDRGAGRDGGDLAVEREGDGLGDGGADVDSDDHLVTS